MAYCSLDKPVLQSKMVRMKFFTRCILAAALLFTAPPALAAGAPEGMVLIPGGCFKMGTDKVFYYEHDEKNTREQPAHKVCLDPFYMDITEVPQKKWDALMKVNNAAKSGPDYPITHIQWHEARAYCKRRGHRLPSEAEWEYAARAGSQGDNPWGEGVDRDALWYAGNSVRMVSPVGRKKANAFGLHDMMGNVWEWVEDWYSPHYYEESPVDNPPGPEQISFHVVRGASWLDEAENIRVTIRYPGETDMTEDFWVGVRCAADAKK
jgi:formylglycine-generating enzyme required for sulfatase activity